MKKKRTRVGLKAYQEVVKKKDQAIADWQSSEVRLASHVKALRISRSNQAIAENEADHANELARVYRNAMMVITRLTEPKKAVSDAPTRAWRAPAVQTPDTFYTEEDARRDALRKKKP